MYLGSLDMTNGEYIFGDTFQVSFKKAHLKSYGNICQQLDPENFRPNTPKGN